MNPYFNDQHAKNLLCLESAKWIGTPFAPHAAVRGAGVDCVQLVAQILCACGHAESYSLPKYVMDGGKHNATSQLEDWLEARNDFGRVASAEGVINRPKPEWAKPGDVLCFNIGRSAHHCGVLIHGKTFVHSLFRRKVEFKSLADGNFALSLTRIYRPLGK